MSKTDRSWYPSQVDFDWIEAIARAPHEVLLEMEAAAEPEGIPILSRDSNAFRYSGFGTHEMVKYYYLVRELLASCYESAIAMRESARARPGSRSMRDPVLRESPTPATRAPTRRATSCGSGGRHSPPPAPGSRSTPPP